MCVHCYNTISTYPRKTGLVPVSSKCWGVEPGIDGGSIDTSSQWRTRVDFREIKRKGDCIFSDFKIIEFYQ